MTNYVVHHDRDNDGYLSAYLAMKALGRNGNSVVLIGHDYKSPVDKIKQIPDGARVFMLDISLDLSDMIELAKRTQLTWIDHHKKTYEDYLPHLRDICEIIYGKLAACRLTFEYFNYGEIEPSYVKNVGMYDTFQGFESDYWYSVTLPYEYTLRGLVKDAYGFSFIENLLESDIINMGLPIVGYVQSQVDSQANHASIVEWKGLKALVSIGGGDSGMWYRTERVKTEKPDILVFCYFNLDSKSWKLSLRQGVSDKKVDCAKLASKYKFEGKKGGGHFDAAGMRCKRLPFKK